MTSLGIELTSTVFPEELLSKLRGAMVKVATENARKAQLVLVIPSIVNVMKSNVVLSAFSELNQIKGLLRETDEMKTYPSKANRLLLVISFFLRLCAPITFLHRNHIIRYIFISIYF